MASFENSTFLRTVQNKLPETVHYHHALYYSIEGEQVRCEMCPHECLLKEHETGICKTRINIGMQLWSLSYGHPVAAHVDPVEKKPLNHFLPGSNTFSLGTAGCNLSCLNCQNWEISTASPLSARYIDLSPQRVIDLAVQHRCNSISYTYNDPVVFYEYALDIAKLAHQSNLANIMVSAAYINPKPLKQIAPLIDAANIDLKTFDADTYKRLNKASLPDVLNALIILKENNVWVEITNLIIPTYTDNPHVIRTMCKWLCNNGFKDSPLHFSRFTPMHKLGHLHPTPIATLEMAIDIAKEEGMAHVYIGNVINHPSEHTYCANCGHLLIERTGYHTHLLMAHDGRCPHCGTETAGVWRKQQ